MTKNMIFEKGKWNCLEINIWKKLKNQWNIQFSFGLSRSLWTETWRNYERTNATANQKRETKTKLKNPKKKNEKRKKKSSKYTAHSTSFGITTQFVHLLPRYHMVEKAIFLLINFTCTLFCFSYSLTWYGMAWHSLCITVFFVLSCFSFLFLLYIVVVVVGVVYFCVFAFGFG